jgi:hypothetical protein
MPLVPETAEEVELAKRMAKRLEDPMAGLKSADAKERLLTAGMLLGRYRLSTNGAGKQVPIDAAESKLILEILAASDWNTAPELMPTGAPRTLFLQLGLEAKDGWQQPGDLRELPVAARKWLRDNAGTYRIKRFAE